MASYALARWRCIGRPLGMAFAAVRVSGATASAGTACAATATATAAASRAGSGVVVALGLSVTVFAVAVLLTETIRRRIVPLRIRSIVATLGTFAIRGRAGGIVRACATLAAPSTTPTIP